MRSLIRALVLPALIAGAMALGPWLPQVASAQVVQETICIDMDTGQQVPCWESQYTTDQIVVETTPEYVAPTYYYSYAPYYYGAYHHGWHR